MTTMLITIFCDIFCRNWCKNRQKHMRKQVRHGNRDLELRMKELTDRHFQADAKLERGMRGRQHRFSFGFSWNKGTEEEKVRQQEALEEEERTGAPPPEPINVRTSFFRASKEKRDEVSKFEGGQDEKKKIDDAKVEEI
jgi:predicted DsbA family dithiol-disulfide isomerase